PFDARLHGLDARPFCRSVHSTRTLSHIHVGARSADWSIDGGVRCASTVLLLQFRPWARLSSPQGHIRGTENVDGAGMIEAANTSGGSPVAAPDDGSQGMGAFEGRSLLKTWI